MVRHIVIKPVKVKVWFTEEEIHILRNQIFPKLFGFINESKRSVWEKLIGSFYPNHSYQKKTLLSVTPQLGVEGQIKIIEEYLKKASQRFKKWETKPRRLYLYHSYGEEAKVFEIVYPSTRAGRTEG